MDENQRMTCPACGAQGTKVKTVTLHALLKPEYAETPADHQYRFCDTPDCDVVYFAEHSPQVYRKETLRVRVGIKEAGAPRPVCYCFGHSVESIVSEITATGTSMAVADVKARLQSGCWCETRNPQGRCCLGLVTRVVKEALARHTDATVVMPPSGEHVDAHCEVDCSLATDATPSNRSEDGRSWSVPTLL